MTHFSSLLSTSPDLPSLIAIFNRDFPTSEYMVGKCNCGDPEGAFKAWARGPVIEPDGVAFILEIDLVTGATRPLHNFEWETEVIHDHSLEGAFTKMLNKAMELSG